MIGLVAHITLCFAVVQGIAVFISLVIVHFLLGNHPRSALSHHGDGQMQGSADHDGVKKGLCP